MKNAVFIVIMMIHAIFGFSQNCGEFELFNFKDTVVTDWIGNVPTNGFYFDMKYDTLIAINSGYMSFYLVDHTGDTITNKEYLAWGRLFPFSSNDTIRYTMIFDSNLSALPTHFNGHLATANPACQIPVSFRTNSIYDINKHQFIKLFPNPTNSSVQMDKFCSKLRVYDMAGKLVLNETNSESLDLSSLNPGIYLLQLVIPNGIVANKKIIKY